ncbi:MAG: hypothetical protein ACRD63_00650, partial [Pyrinomonadaceae bacterium]
MNNQTVTPACVILLSTQYSVLFNKVRSKRATINYFSQVLLTGVTMVVGFVSTPFLLHWLGAERFGAVRVANELYGHLVLLELGLSGALPA